jgi:hypothetical protein
MVSQKGVHSILFFPRMFQEGTQKNCNEAMTILWDYEQKQKCFFY